MKLNFRDGFVWELMLQGGGVRNFLWFTLIVGVITLLFSWITGSLLPFGFFALMAILVFCFICYLASTPDGRLFFLDSNSYFRIIKMQMGLMGDSTGIKKITSKTEYVQPIVMVGDQIMTETKQDSLKALEEKQK